MDFPVWRPPADILRRGEHWFIKMELAGVRPEELDIALRGGTLGVRGCRRDLLLEEGCLYHSLEIRYSRFERFLELPFSADPESLRWQYRDGMLLVELRRKEMS